jgi:predicted secreted protein
MIHARRFLVVAVVLLFAVSAARAGDFANLNFLGFSKDAKYLAFEEYGVQDGSGFPYSNIYFVDVAKNSFASAPIIVRLENETSSEQQARSRAKVRAAVTLKKLRIIERNTGTLVVSRLLTDAGINSHLSDEPGKNQTINFAELIGSMYRRGDYDLVLKPVAVKPKECDYSDQTVYKFELSLKDNMEDKVIVLQKDATLPSSRACPIDYAMQHVYIYENAIAVFVNTYHIGFEGPDMRYMVVTGKYK